MVCLTIRGRNDTKVQFYAVTLAHELAKHVARDVILGEPNPAPLAKIQGYHRYQLILRADKLLRLTETLTKVLPAMKPPEDVTVQVDVDPLSLL
jgi:primosomal protein N'